LNDPLLNIQYEAEADPEASVLGLGRRIYRLVKTVSNSDLQDIASAASSIPAPAGLTQANSSVIVAEVADAFKPVLDLTGFASFGVTPDPGAIEDVAVDWQPPLIGKTRRSVWHLLRDRESEEACRRFAAAGRL
jgi:hypothetical protein